MRRPTSIAEELPVSASEETLKAKRTAHEPTDGRAGAVPTLQPAPRSSVATIILATLAVAYALVVARPVLLPIAFAWLAKSALGPLVRKGGQLGIAPPVGAALILLALSAGAVYGLYELSGPATEWAERLPGEIREIRQRLREGSAGIENPIASVNEATAAVAELTSRDEANQPLKVSVTGSTPSDYLIGGVWDFGANLTIILVLLYFMLATGDAFLSKIVQLTSRRENSKAAITASRAIERGIARYLLTVVAINGSLGALVGCACYLFGLPNPLLWGAIAMVCNFVPYVGALAGIGLVAAVGLSGAPAFWPALAPAAIYGLLTIFEGMLVTPVVVGRQLTLSPVLLFVWLLLMSWLWGIPGALLAVPLLAAGKITCDHVPRLRPIGQLLGT